MGQKEGGAGIWKWRPLWELSETLRNLGPSAPTGLAFLIGGHTLQGCPPPPHPWMCCPRSRAHVRLGFVGVGVGHGVGEPELELGAAQVRLAVVLDEGVDAGEHEVVRQVVLHGPALHGGADPAVLDPAGPPVGRGTTSVSRPAS